jgi:PPOX class probable F420-dependent enzyme
MLQTGYGDVNTYAISSAVSAAGLNLSRMTVLDDLARAHYVSLTTFRKNGTGVATPVWHAVDNGELFIWSETDAWKVKRVRNNGRAIVTACNVRGKIAPGAATAEGTARILDQSENDRIRALFARKYWIVRATEWFTAIVPRFKRKGTAIAVTF